MSLDDSLGGLGSLIDLSLGNYGPLFYMQTNKDAAREKLVTVDISKQPCEFKDLIPENPEALLSQTALVHDHIVLTYSHNVSGWLSGISHVNTI